MKNRFDLENEINELYLYANQIDLICDTILNTEEHIDKDCITNALMGIKILLDMKTNQLYDTMCQSFNLNSCKETV